MSIITVTYNSESTVRDTLLSVQNQDYPHIEHIIVDGGSSDRTVDIVKEFPHVATIISESDDGIYDAMNKGISLCSGDVVGVLNSDDFYVDRSVISDVVLVMLESSSRTVYADLNYVKKGDVNKIVRRWRSGKFNREYFKWGWMPPHPTFFAQRQLYMEFGLYNLAFKSAADYELMLRFLFKEKVEAVHVNRVIVTMRSGGKSNKSLVNRIVANAEDKMAWRVNDLVPYFFTIYIKPVRKILQYFFFLLLIFI